jgi:hypothetical protein
MYHIQKFIRRIIARMFPFRLSKKQQQNARNRFIDPATGQYRKMLED